MEKIEKLLHDIVSAIVSNPEDIKIIVKKDEMGVLYSLELAPHDFGKVIGKSGETANAIRYLLRCVGAQERVRASLKIDAPDSRFREEPRKKSFDDAMGEVE